MVFGLAAFGALGLAAAFFGAFAGEEAAGAAGEAGAGAATVAISC